MKTKQKGLIITFTKIKIFVSYMHFLLMSFYWTVVAI